MLIARHVGSASSTIDHRVCYDLDCFIAPSARTRLNRPRNRLAFLPRFQGGCPMRVARLCVLPLLSALVSHPAPAQNQAQTTSRNPSQPPSLSPEQRADSEALRALTNSVPLLPVERIELKVNPPMKLVGYSAAAADKHGNIYVIHRPADPKVDD